MERRRMDKLGIAPSLLGFGGMRFPTTPEGKIDYPAASLLLERAYEQGVNYFDTAYPYHNGESEVFFGSVLKKYDRSTFYLATKLPVWEVKSLQDVDRIFEDQLRKLQMDYVDFYLLHALDREDWHKMLDLGVVKRLEELKAEGRIRYLGFSFHDCYEAFEEILRCRDWDFCQIQLNYMDTEIQAGMKGYRLTEEMGIPLIIMEPVKGGSLAGFSGDIAGKFREMDSEASMASFALRWVGSLPNVKVILSGMSNMDQVEDNLKTFRKFQPLSDEERKKIQEIVTLIKGRVQNGCTGCKYCMPCPAGVDIPGCFKVWNMYHMYQNYNVVKHSWENLLGDKKQAKNCVKCGKCEHACPQQIPIRADLEKVQADLERKE